MGLHPIDFDLDEIVETLTDTGRLERGSAAYGVAQMVIHWGYDALKPRQRDLYDAEVLPGVTALAAERRAAS